MNKCINCDNEATGRSKYCSGRCKVAYNRNKLKAESVTDVTETVPVTVDDVTADKPANFGESNCDCWHCKKVKGSVYTLNHGPHKSSQELAIHELNRVSLPGDVDYDGVCQE